MYRDGIGRSRLFVCMLPEKGFEGSEGEDMLRYAIEIGKPIILWRPRGNESIPTMLDGYTDYKVTDGDARQVADLAREFLEVMPGEEVRIIRQGYGEV